VRAAGLPDRVPAYTVNRLRHGPAGDLVGGDAVALRHPRPRGLAASVASFRRYVAANVPEEVRRQQVTVWNPRLAGAGEQAQIDYGMLGRWAVVS
jgi:hypothetical protein